MVTLVDPADMELIWRHTFNGGSVTLRGVSFCPCCGQLHIGQVTGCCFVCAHPVVQLPYSPERMAAFRLDGPDGVRALDRKVMPGDKRLSHQGGWLMCPCKLCADRRMTELAP